MLSLFLNRKKEEPAPKLSFLPPALSPYSKELWKYAGPNNFDGKVAIVGAGIAGLTAAYFLAQQDIDIEIIEADSMAGGRIKTNHSFADFPLDLGAAWIHGENSCFFHWLHKMGANLYEDQSEELIWLDGQLLHWKEDRRLRQWGYALEELEDLKVDDISLWQWAMNENFDHSIRHIIQYSANELGSSPERIGVKAYGKASKLWSSGELNFKITDSFYNLIDHHLIQPLSHHITFNCPITNIRYEKSKILLKTNDYRFFTADKVIITTPITILQEGLIKFVPPLPLKKREAISKIKMDEGLKVFLKFKKRFWPDNIIGSKWCSSYIDAKYGRVGQDEVLEAFIMGKHAELLTMLSAEELTELLLTELDQLFNQQAHQFYIDTFVQNWGKMPYISGAYSYSSIGEKDSRQILQESINQKLYFAGEACNLIGHHQTVHGAFESGYEQALRLLLDTNSSSLYTA